jgi:hypothetical protein
VKFTGSKTYYGNIQALKGVTLDINDGEIVTLIVWIRFITDFVSSPFMPAVGSSRRSNLGSQASALAISSFL